MDKYQKPRVATTPPNTKGDHAAGVWRAIFSTQAKPQKKRPPKTQSAPLFAGLEQTVQETKPQTDSEIPVLKDKKPLTKKELRFADHVKYLPHVMLTYHGFRQLQNPAPNSPSLAPLLLPSFTQAEQLFLLYKVAALVNTVAHIPLQYKENQSNDFDGLEMDPEYNKRYFVVASTEHKIEINSFKKMHLCTILKRLRCTVPSNPFPFALPSMQDFEKRVDTLASTNIDGQDLYRCLITHRDFDYLDRQARMRQDQARTADSYSAGNKTYRIRETHTSQLAHPGPIYISKIIQKLGALQRAS